MEEIFKINLETYHKYIYPKKGKKINYYGKSQDHKYGIELEVEFHNYNDWDSSINEIEESFGEYLWMTLDNSLENFGLEIVSQPLSLEYHQWLWMEICKILNKYSANISEKCGMHIHIDRRTLSKEKQMNIYERICNPIYIDEILKIMNREPNIYCKFVYPWNETINVEKYLAVNFLHKNTLEVRIFSSTLDYTLIYERLKWINGMIYYS